MTTIRFQMRNVAAIAACLTVIMFASCKKEEDKKTVTVGEQQGELFTGTAGMAIFTVTTENIANGSAITLNKTEASISLGTTATTGNKTEVSINTTAATPQGEHSLTLTIDGAKSEPFTLAVGSAKKTVTVGMQNGWMTAGGTETVSYTVTTANIADGAYTATGNRPAGVTIQGQVTIANNSGTLMLAGSTNTTAGTYNNLTLTIDGVSSAMFSLKIDDVFLLEEMYYDSWRTVFEYDNQDRILKMTHYQDDGNLYGYTTLTYDPATGDLVEKIERDKQNTELLKETYIKNGNTISWGGWGEIVLNPQGLPEKYTFNNMIDIQNFTWQNGNLTKEEGGSIGTFTYDDKKSPFYHCKTPKWFLLRVWERHLCSVNNIKTETWGYGVETHGYVYNDDGFPTTRTAYDETQTFTYMKR